MSDHPKISIISTVYNTGPYLRPAVESILAQTFTDFVRKRKHIEQR